MEKKYAIWDVDTQNDFMDKKGKLPITGATGIYSNLEKVMAYAKLNKVQVLGSVDWHNRDDPELSADPDFKETFPPHCLAGTWGAEKVKATYSQFPLWIDSDGRMEYRGATVNGGTIENAIRSAPAEVYLRKQKFDVFSNPHTEEVLRVLEPTDIIVIGVALEVCNDYAITGLAQRGYNVYAVTDAMKPISEDSRQAMHDKWTGLGVKLVTTEDVLEGRL